MTTPSKWISCSLRYGTSKEDKVFEKLILNLPWESYTAQKAYQYAKNILNKRWKEGEGAISSHSYYAYQYAKYVIKDRWPEAEDSILEHPNSAYLYAKYILRRRWPEAEERVKWLDSLNDFYLYCKYVRKERWVEIEKKINKQLSKKVNYWNVSPIISYIKHVSKSRWEKMEEHIANSHYIKDYMKILNNQEKEEFYNKVLMCAMVDTNRPTWQYNHAKAYIEKQKDAVSS